jgi:hypothetical protein
MDKNKRNFFDRISDGIGSQGFIIIAMFGATGAMTVCSHAMFDASISETMSMIESFFATWSFAIVWEWTTLITTIHVKKLKSWMPNAMAILSGVIMLFFLRVDEFFYGEMTVYEFIRRIIFGVIAGMMNRVFSHLFVQLREERQAKISEPSRVVDLESEVAQLGSKLVQVESKLIQTESKLKEAESKLVQATAFKAVYDEQRTCPYCSRVMETPSSLTVHKGKCPQNPINLDKPVAVAPIKLNGVQRVFREGAVK